MGALVFAPARVLQVQPIAVWKDALLKRLTKPLNLSGFYVSTASAQGPPGLWLVLAAQLAENPSS